MSAMMVSVVALIGVSAGSTQTSRKYLTESSIVHDSLWPAKKRTIRLVTKLSGFILQASYRVQSGPAGTRIPVIHIYGRLEDGGTFLVREHRQRPHFYVRTADVQRASVLTSMQPTPLGKRTFDGAPVSRFEKETPNDVPGLRDRLHDIGIDTFEADVRFAIRYLIERGIKGGCEIEG